MKKITFAALLFAASSVFAAPDPMLRQLEPFAGTWRCSGTAFATPNSPEHATSGEVTQKWALDGMWMMFDYAESKSAANPMPFHITGYFGYDSELKKFVLGGADNMGGYSTEQSDGWNGDTLVFAGPWHMPGMTVNSRDTFRKKGSTQLSHTGEVEQNGAWVKVVEEQCTKK
jgi:hypothetical protein